MREKIIQAEVNRKLHALHNHCTQLLGQDYPSRGSHTLLRLFQKITLVIQGRFDFYSSNQIIFVGALCKYIEQYIGHINSSKMTEVPWSIIPALENLFGHIRPNCEFVICPLWETNYQIINSNLIQEIRRQVLEVPGLLFDQNANFQKNVEAFLLEVPTGLYFLFYPRLERLSVLHFSLLGHEIGHIFADEWLEKNWEKFLNDFKIEATLSEHFEKEFGRPEEQYELFRPQYVKVETVESMKKFKRIMKELLSDIFGVLIFGPSCLLSYYLFALNSQLDDLQNIPSGYLPWRYRLRLLRYVLRKMGFGTFGLEDTLSREWFDMISDTCDKTPELDALKKDKKLSHFAILVDAVQEWRDKIYDDMVRFDKSKRYLYIHAFSEEAHKEVVERLKNGITPNAKVGEDLVEQPIDLRNIVLGTWTHVTSIPLDDYKLYTEDSMVANLLSLKAIELSTIQEGFNDAYKKGNQTEITSRV